MSFGIGTHEFPVERVDIAFVVNAFIIFFAVEFHHIVKNQTSARKQDARSEQDPVCKRIKFKNFFAAVFFRKKRKCRQNQKKYADNFFHFLT